MRKKLIAAALVLAAAAGAYAGAQTKKQAAELMINQLLEAKEPQETRKLMSPDQFMMPYVSETYQIAAKNREALDKQFCYCFCALNPMFKHKSLLSCFVDDHGANCGICMSQARETAIMTKAGKTPKEIAVYFKEKYAKNMDHMDHSH